MQATPPLDNVVVDSILAAILRRNACDWSDPLSGPKIRRLHLNSRFPLKGPDMSFEHRGETVMGLHDVEDLKLVYRTLHAHLAEHPELMETHFLIELQNFLHARARAEGVDTTHHGAWDAWLGNADAVPCDVRVQGRRTVDP
jgi:hypothetical protein